MDDQKKSVLFITDSKFIEYTIAGGVQICTSEFIEYIEKAGFSICTFKVNTSAKLTHRIKAKLGVESYEIYNVDPYLEGIVNVINTRKIQFVLLNQLNLSYWVVKIKNRVNANVKFIGLSHGNESGDFLHEITKTSKTSFLQTWRLGRLLVKEKELFSEILDGVITISDNETSIDQWLGAQNILFLPRILKPGFINWNPVAKTIGFVGTLDHLPNLSGIELLSNQLQLNGFDGQFRLVGAPSQLGYQLEKRYTFIKYCGVLSNQQLMEEMGNWSIFLNPVFWHARGSSTKLSQGINWGIPVITTPAGVRGYDLINKDMITADNLPATFAGMVLKAIGSDLFLKELKQASVDNAINFNSESWAGKLSIYLNKL